MSEVVLAFDIEYSGYEVIAIGASVVNADFIELDRFFFGNYVPDVTQFEHRCWNEFWSKTQDILDIIKYKGDQNDLKEKRELEMITQFQQFRAKWEGEKNLILVTDNNIFDGGLINQLIKKYLPNTEGIPYSASKDENGKQQYQPFWETFSQQKGLLMGIEPNFRSDWGLTDKIFELYEVNKPKVPHDHNPANDAYTIAYDQQILFGIRDGRIIRRKMEKSNNLNQI